MEIIAILPGVFLGGGLGALDLVARVDSPHTTAVGLAGSLLLPVLSTRHGLLLGALDGPVLLGGGQIDDSLTLGALGTGGQGLGLGGVVCLVEVSSSQDDVGLVGPGVTSVHGGVGDGS